jgi:hypothetical protein
LIRIIQSGCRLHIGEQSPRDFVRITQRGRDYLGLRAAADEGSECPKSWFAVKR